MKLRRWASALSVALLFLSIASPAFAHEDLIESSPSENEALTTAPTEVSLTFTQDLFDEPGYYNLNVLDSIGTNWVEGAPEMTANVMTARLKTGMAEGSYTLNWKGTAPDGHTISGAIPFTVGQPSPSSDENTEAGEESPTVDSSPTDSQAVTTAAASTDMSRTILIASIGAIVGVGLFFAVWLIAFRRRRNDADTSTQK